MSVSSKRAHLRSYLTFKKNEWPSWLTGLFLDQRNKFLLVFQVPFDTEEKLRDWMYSVYKEKDEMLGKLFLNEMFFLPSVRPGNSY